MLKAKWTTSLLLAVAIGFTSPASVAQLPDFTVLVEQNNAAVVNISTTQKIAATDGHPQMPEGMDIP
ncbi:MAG: hypothetical protein ACK443_01850, partial [Methylococcaceae bacterium]